MSLKILIVDDSALIRRALRALLEAGHEWEVCGEAADGIVALEMAKKLNPDLIVLDLSMPGMNGFQLAREIKNFRSSLPVLMFTGFKTPQLEEQAIASGCNAVVSKSEHQQMLFENIHRLLQH